MSIREYCPTEGVTISHFDLKRAFDLSLGFLLALAALPLCLTIALLIKLNSKGPVLYAGERLGKEGKTFRCWKFRSMCLQAEEKLQHYLAENPLLKEEWETYYKLKHDPRVTWIGKLLRKTSLDELPQLWSVLKGDLSLVGPRPYLLEEIQSSVGHRAKTILSIRPGMTGLWQVSGRSSLPFQERIRLDEEYVSRRSFALDLKLLLKTFPVVFCARGY